MKDIYKYKFDDFDFSNNCKSLQFASEMITGSGNVHGFVDTITVYIKHNRIII